MNTEEIHMMKDMTAYFASILSGAEPVPAPIRRQVEHILQLTSQL